MSEALVEATPAYTPNTGPSYKRLTIADIAIVLALHDDGKSQVEIAQRLGVTQPTISQVLSQMGTDSAAIAKRLFHGRAYKSARRVIGLAEKSTDEPVALKAARTVLEVAGVLQSGQQLTVGVQVVMGQPSHTALQAQQVTVVTVPQTDTSQNP